MPSAINRNRLPGDPGRVLGGEEQDERRDLDRLSGTAERVRFLRSRQEGRVVVLVHAATAMQVRDRHTRIDRVHAHAVRRPINRRAPREVIERALAGVVSSKVGKYALSVDARHVHDGAATLPELRERGAHQDSA